MAAAATFTVTAEITSGNAEIVFIGLLINDGDGGEYSFQHYPKAGGRRHGLRPA